MNKFIGLARLGRDAEVRYTAQGTAVANFPAAVDVGYGDKKETLWLDCAMFGKRAESKLIEYLTKGTQCIVEGEINLRQFKKRDETHGAAVTLNVQDLTLVDSKPSEEKPEQKTYQQHSQSKPAPGGPGPENDFDDDIPFAPVVGV